MSIGEVLDLYIKFVFSEPGITVFGALTLLGLLTVLALLLSVFHAIIERVWCRIRGHKWFAKEECVRCGRVQNL